jgi:hypothetical protein
LIGLEQLDFSEESGWMWVPGEEFNLDRVGDWVGSEGGEGGKVDSGQFVLLGSPPRFTSLPLALVSCSRLLLGSGLLY